MFLIVEFVLKCIGEGEESFGRIFDVVTPVLSNAKGDVKVIRLLLT